MSARLPITFVAVVLAAACGDDLGCPDGAVETEGRCIEADARPADAGDTGTDADTGTSDADTGTADTNVPDGSTCTTACTDPTPLCDEEGAQGPVGGCVACVSEDDCGGDTPYCDAGFCVQCTAATADDDCDATAPVCGTDGACTGCTTFADCARFPLIAACAMSGDQAGQCVQCTADDQCTGVDAARCDLTDGSATLNTCVACDNSTQCEGILVDGDPVPICLLEGDDAGTCVECTSDDDCEGVTCDPVAHVCTETTPGTVEACNACLSDTDCEDDHYCVPMTFGEDEEERGFYCLRDRSLGRAQPFSIDIEDRTSRSGREGGRYFGIVEATTTCEAVRALLANAQCGDDGEPACPEGGLCRDLMFADGNRCTYECGGAVQCDAAPNPGSTCGPGGSAGEDYCGG